MNKFTRKEQWFDDMRSRVADDEDIFLPIFGGERMGKSTAAFILGHILDEDFNHERMVFEPSSFIAAGSSGIPPGSVVVMDESVQGGLNYDWNTPEAKMLLKWFVVCGERRLVNIMLFPNINWFAKYLRNHRMTYHGLVQKDRVTGKRWFRVFEPLPVDFEGAKPFRKEVCRFPFAKAEGPDWDAYLAKKRDYVLKARDHRFGAGDSPDAALAPHQTKALQTLAGRVIPSERIPLVREDNA